MKRKSIGRRMKNGILSDLSGEEREIVEYGIGQGVVLLIGMVMAIMMGILLKIPDKVIPFLMCSYYLRIYAGGYHAKTQFWCSIISAIATFLCLLWLKYVELPLVILHVLLLVAGMLIVVCAPVDNEKRKLDEIEKKLYSKRVRIIVVVVSLIYVVSVLLKWDSLYCSINLSVIFVAISVLIGVMSNKRGKRDENFNM